MTQVLTVTRDAGANVKKLRDLERLGLIRCHDVLLENGRENKKISRKIRPILGYPYYVYGEGVWADENCKYNAISAIIGKEKVADAMHLEAHLRYEHDVFVSEDNDFLSKRDQLKAAFGCEIMTPDELVARLTDDDPA